MPGANLGVTYEQDRQTFPLYYGAYIPFGVIANKRINDQEIEIVVNAKKIKQDAMTEQYWKGQRGKTFWGGDTQAGA